MMSTLKRVQPSYKKSIPVEKYQKIFYPKRYTEERIRHRTNTSKSISIDYQQLVERDLYKRKSNRINFIFCHNLTPQKLSNINKPLLKMNLKEPREELQNKGDIPRFSFLIELRSKSHKNNTIKGKLIQSTFIKELLTTNYRSNKEGLLPIQKDSYTNTEIEFKKMMQEKGGELEGVKSLLKHIMEEHDPILTQKNLEINKYKKGYRETLGFTGTRNNKSVELKKKCEAYLKSRIQFQKDKYIRDVEKKLRQVNSNKPVVLIKRKSNLITHNINNKDIYNTANQSIIQVITRKSTKPRLIYGNIKSAINDLTSDMKCTQLSDYSIKLKQNTGRNYLISQTTLDADNYKKNENSKKLKRLITSIEHSNKIANGYLLHVHNFTKSLDCSINYKSLS